MILIAYYVNKTQLDISKTILIKEIVVIVRVEFLNTIADSRCMMLRQGFSCPICVVL